MSQELETMLRNTETCERLDERGVSPVIGVILMVAITVILAAVIGAFVMDLGGNVSQNPQVGLSFDEDPSNNEVTMTVNSAPRVDSLSFDPAADMGSSDAAVSAGNTYTFSGLSGSGTITVTATYQGESVVVAQYDYDVS